MFILVLFVIGGEKPERFLPRPTREKGQTEEIETAAPLTRVERFQFRHRYRVVRRRRRRGDPNTLSAFIEPSRLVNLFVTIHN